ncbi:MAG: 50S ribosomal protein L11 methyltransferase [Solirubrobacteraceae bacterium]
MIRLAVRVASGQAEVVLAELLELAPAGVEEVQGEAGTVEYAVYGAPGELPDLPDVRAVVGDALVEISTTEIPDDWHERWKQFHRSVLIGAPRRAHGGRPPIPSLHVRPPWEAASAPGPGSVREIVIDPGQAFGTGAHASTRLCLELLLELAAQQQPSGPLLDVGTGSGVLAIAAAGLGFAPVLGLDHEQESVDAARENAAVNGVEIEVRRFDLRRQALPWMNRADAPGGPPVVLANLLRPLLLDLAASMPTTPAHLLAGGLLEGEVDEVVRAFSERLGLREHERRVSGEWAAVWLSAT